MFSKINSHNGWDKLKEVIVGTCEGTTGTITWDRKKKIDQKILDQAIVLAKESFPNWLSEEVEDDLNGLATILQKLDVIVHRPKPFDLSNIYSSPFWYSNSNNLYNARDLNLVVGNIIVESPSYLASRYFENTAYYEIFYKYFERGFKWIAGPKPKLNYEVQPPYFIDNDNRELTSENIKHKTLTKGRLEQLYKLAEREIVFEAANTLRMGKDLLYLVSSSGNFLGAKWLQSVLGNEYKVHITKDIYRSSHIDSTLMALKPGLILINTARVNEKNYPAIFKKWEKICFEEVAPTTEAALKIQKDIRDPIAYKLKELGFSSNIADMSSPWVGMNLLSVDQGTVLVDKRQEKLIRLLEKKKFKVIPIRMRHLYIFSGGLHCATLDTVRDSKLESYFD